MASLTTLTSRTSYWRMLFHLLPRGPAWSKTFDLDTLNRFDSFSPLEAFVYALAEELRLVHNRLVDLADEADPRTADETLQQWLDAWGLPAPSLTMPTTDAAKRELLAGKVAAQGGQSIDYFTRIAQVVLGDDQDAVEIVERPYGNVFRAWSGEAWDEVNGVQTAHYWRVYLPATATTTQADAIEALFGAFKPAHTVVEIVRPVVAIYSSPGAVGDYAQASTNIAARTVIPLGAPADFAVSMWVKSPTWAEIPFGVGTLGGGAYPNVAGYYDGNINWDFCDDANAVDGFVSATPPTVDVWHHLCLAAVIGGDAVLYLDGVAVSTGDISGWAPVTLGATDFRLFDDGGGGAGGPTLEGDLANVAIFARALTSTEVAALSTAGRKHDVRRSVTDWTGETPATYWRDLDTAGAVVSVGAGGDCELTLEGAVTSASDWT